MKIHLWASKKSEKKNKKYMYVCIYNMWVMWVKFNVSEESV